MSALAWEAPVSVIVSSGKQKIVKSPAEAVGCLEREWPIADGVFLREAKKVCIAALEHECTASEARDAFEMASLEALLVCR